MSYSLGILDQSIRIEGESNEDTLARTVKLAQKAEEWGYKRFWVAEHHNTEEVAGSAPEVLSAFILAKTNKIRVGSGGVMLQHYSPYKVAEQFQVLAALAPGRVDLGVGKGPGGLPLSTKALAYGTTNQTVDFEDKLVFLKNIIEGNAVGNPELLEVKATPEVQIPQKIILLGASENSAKQAKKHGLPYTFANFFNGDNQELIEAIKTYKKDNLSAYFILSLLVIAAETKEEAEALIPSQQLFKVTLESGRTVRVKDENDAHDYGKQSGEEYKVEAVKNNYIVGTAEDVKNQLDELHEKYGIDEFVLHIPIPNVEKREKAFELLKPSNQYQFS